MTATGLAGFLSVFNTSFVVAAVVLVAFSMFRMRQKTFYQPRRRLNTIKNPPPPQPTGFLSWMPFIWKMSDDEIISSVGIDALVFLKFNRLAIKIFAVIAVYGLCVLIPINEKGENNIKDLDRLSMANIANLSPKLWAHSVGAWIVSVVFYYLMYTTYRDVTHLSQQHRFSDRPNLYTVMVSEVPEDHQTDADVAEFFEQFYPGQVYQATMARDYSVLQDIDERREAAKESLRRAILEYEASGERPQHRPIDLLQINVTSMVGELVDSIEYYEDEIADLRKSHASERKKRRPPFSVAFVTFTSAQTAAQVSQSWFANDGWKVRMAPEPRDVFWPNLALSTPRKTTRSFLVAGAIFWLCFFWAIPVAFISSLTTLDELEKAAPFLKPLVEQDAVVKSVIVGLVPTLALTLLMSLLPAVLHRLTVFEGLVSFSDIEKSVMKKLYYFEVVNTFFVVTLSGAIFASLHQIIESPTSIVKLLGVSIPKQSNFFTSYVVLNALGNFPLEFLRIVPLVLGMLYYKRAVTPKEKRDAFDPGEMDYGSLYSSQLLVFTVALSYSTIAPFILPWAVGYFVLAQLTWTHQLVYVYRQKYQTDGSYWPAVVSRMIVALLIYQCTVIGVVSLKYGYKEGPFMLPLPFITALFFSFVHLKFRKANETLPLEVAREFDIRRMANPDLSFLKDAYLPKWCKPELTEEEDENSLKHATFDAYGDDATLLTDAELRAHSNGGSKSGHNGYMALDDGSNSSSSKHHSHGSVESTPWRFQNRMAEHHNDNVSHDFKSNANNTVPYRGTATAVPMESMPGSHASTITNADMVVEEIQTPMGATPVHGDSVLSSQQR
jgi:calcium permeable stress-gated cation channel